MKGWWEMTTKGSGQLGASGVRCAIVQVITSMFGEIPGVADGQVPAWVLHAILSDSRQALELVIAIENEFNIEFRDDEVDIDFFMDLQRIVELVEDHLATHKISTQEADKN
jgi:hypothetical protein